MHLLVDSTGLKLCGAGEWLIEKHGTHARRSWRKLHIGLDAETGQIVASALTDRDVDDASQVGPLLDQVAGAVAAFTADGAYDQGSTYDEVAQRHPDAAVVVPPRSTAVPSETAESAPTQRDRHLQCIAERGRMGWQTRSGYNARARAEAAIARWKQVIGDGRSRPRFRVRSTWNVGGGCARAGTSAGRPRWTSPSTRSTACWSWDARSLCASPDPGWGWGECAWTPGPCNTPARARWPCCWWNAVPCARSGSSNEGAPCRLRCHARRQYRNVPMSEARTYCSCLMPCPAWQRSPRPRSITASSSPEF